MSRLLTGLMLLVTIGTCGILYALLQVKTDSTSPSPQLIVKSKQLNHRQLQTGPVFSVELRAPLTTYTRPTRASLKHCRAIEAVVLVPDDAPDDLGVGAYMKDQDGVWFQQAYHKPLGPGRHHLHFAISADGSSQWQAEPTGIAWSAYQLEHMQSYGLYFWSAKKHNGSVAVHHLRTVKKQALQNGIAVSEPATQKTTQQTQLKYLDGFDPDKVICQAQTGKRWEVHFLPTQLPNNPFNSQLLKYDLLITDKDNQTKRYPGFYYQPVILSDGGNHERAQRQESAYFICRWRPQRAGVYQAQLEKTEHNTASDLIQLPPIHVSGETYDDYVQVSTSDRRFYQIGQSDQAQAFWPIGINLRSVNDSRGHENTPCQATPLRGSLAYDSFLSRYARAGANCAEIWMCSWNLALEWRPGWPGYYGAGFYHEANAARLDAILDKAHELGMRIILVLHNHGQASSKVDSEWLHHPYNTRNGGFLRRARDLFTHPKAIQHQAELRRYIVARYADHPAIMCWKLWTEQDLTDLGMTTRNHHQGRSNRFLAAWHAQAAKDLKRIDNYHHPVVTHWSTDYRIVDPGVAALPEIDSIFIDAYHHRVPGHTILAELLYRSRHDNRLGLKKFNKPVLCTEYGGTPLACPVPQLTAEHHSGPWAAMVSGHAGAPLLWWFEWVDQHGHWHPYRALSNFMQGEDLRHDHARSAKLLISNTKHSCWNRAWVRPGRILGYILDQSWGYQGRSQALISKASLRLGSNVGAGQMCIEWWDASLGIIIQKEIIAHPGGKLEFQIPDFRRHLAYKCYRL